MWKSDGDKLLIKVCILLGSMVEVHILGGSRVLKTILILA